jgi:hypothetical protein
MIFKTLFKNAWTVFDGICYVLAASFINYGVFLVNFKAGLIVLGLTFALTGLASELISEKKGGVK